MTTWEYAAIVVKNDSTIVWLHTGGERKMAASRPIEALNQAGKDGWEAISAETPAHGSAFWGYGNIVYTLKRPI
ncbi:hypothetical protein O7606_15010 [Micromonospora sp. WMMD882]|uniref:hypothetical protein n=1 Tax=Micromonospora sp. WMMD882 TaxID=3015151 RepID=UPI00248BCBC4|nr:hypothetical protein [Micromonospora sp. WMMD882]WBB77592.1 hypothetical protein O7606_15010 [Micromonospora sp. WMMD882]